MRIRRLVDSSDEQHRHAMRADDDGPDEREVESESSPAEDSRRQFVRKLGMGGAVALGTAAVPTALLVRTASAQATGSGGEVDIPAEDMVILEFMVGIELAAEAAYDVALEGRLFDSAQGQMARTFARHHHDHALALGELVGLEEEDLVTPNAALVDAVRPALDGASTADQLWQVFFEIEQNVAATYTEALASLGSQGAVAPAAAILPVESQHGTAIGSLLQLPVDEWMPAFQTTEGAYDPATSAG
jgi:hypothetical protein